MSHLVICHKLLASFLGKNVGKIDYLAIAVRLRFNKLAYKKLQKQGVAETMSFSITNSFVIPNYLSLWFYSRSSFYVVSNNYLNVLFILFIFRTYFYEKLEGLLLSFISVFVYLYLSFNIFYNLLSCLTRSQWN